MVQFGASPFAHPFSGVPDQAGPQHQFSTALNFIRPNNNIPLNATLASAEANPSSSANFPTSLDTMDTSQMETPRPPPDRNRHLSRGAHIDPRLGRNASEDHPMMDPDEGAGASGQTSYEYMDPSDLDYPFSIPQGR